MSKTVFCVESERESKWNNNKVASYFAKSTREFLAQTLGTPAMDSLISMIRQKYRSCSFWRWHGPSSVGLECKTHSSPTHWRYTIQFRRYTLFVSSSLSRLLSSFMSIGLIHGLDISRNSRRVISICSIHLLNICPFLNTKMKATSQGLRLGSKHDLQKKVQTPPIDQTRRESCN